MAFTASNLPRTSPAALPGPSPTGRLPVVRFLLAALAALGLIVAVGYFQGLWTDRWQPSAALVEAVELVQALPKTIGDWEGTDLEERDERSMKRAGAAAFQLRRYENPQNETSLSVLLFCGRTGPMAVHTPEVCYGGAGYQMRDQPERITVLKEGPAEQLWTAHFYLPGSSNHLRIYWAWAGPDRVWEAPEEPRIAFKGARALYKLYIQRPTTADEKFSATDDSVVPFVRQLFAQFGKLTPAATGSIPQAGDPAPG
jgi:hypothetical protein